jgi:hypothetical protein
MPTHSGRLTRRERRRIRHAARLISELIYLRELQRMERTAASLGDDEAFDAFISAELDAALLIPTTARDEADDDANATGARSLSVTI